MHRQIYIHYGATSFDPVMGFPVRNLRHWPKPCGGLWASRKNATFGWKEWCIENEFRECDITNSFEFTSPLYVIERFAQKANKCARETMNQSSNYKFSVSRDTAMSVLDGLYFGFVDGEDSSDHAWRFSEEDDDYT